MAARNLMLRVYLPWYARIYLWVTRFGVWLGLPIDVEKVARDLGKMVKIEGKH